MTEKTIRCLKCRMGLAKVIYSSHGTKLSAAAALDLIQIYCKKCQLVNLSAPYESAAFINEALK
jgi:hypothetical protein